MLFRSFSVASSCADRENPLTDFVSHVVLPIELSEDMTTLKCWFRAWCRPRSFEKNAMYHVCNTAARQCHEPEVRVVMITATRSARQQQEGTFKNDSFDVRMQRMFCMIHTDLQVLISYHGNPQPYHLLRTETSNTPGNTRKA